MKKLVLSMAIIAAFCACRAADEANYTISPYDDVRDHEEVRTIIRKNHKKLCTDANGKPVSPPVEQKRPDKLDDMLSNNTNCSPLIKPIDPSKSFRIVLRTQLHRFVGYASFFENGIEYDAIKKHDGYSSELLTVEEHTEQYPTLIAAMLKKAKEIGLKRFMYHFINNNMRELPEYKATIAAGFTEQQQTDFEKQYNVIRFEKNLQNEADYTISPYDDVREHDEVFNFLSSNVEHFVTLPTDATEAQKQKERLATKSHNSLRNNTPMNPIPHIEGSFRNVLLRHQKQLAGVVTYYMRKDNSNCFIDSLFVNPPHNTSAAYLALVKTVLAYACEKQAGYVQTYESTKRKPLAETEFQALINIGFTECEQTEEEKKWDAVLLQLHTSAAIPLLKLF